MRVIDIMGMGNARNQWACATLNEFRSFLKLARYTSFERELLVDLLQLIRRPDEFSFLALS